MPFDFNSVTSMEAKAVAAPKAVRGNASSAGPNPWLDKDWDMGLVASYDDNQAYELEFPGRYVDAVYTQGEKKGQPLAANQSLGAAQGKRLDGPAAEAVMKIRAASQLLDLGVSIRARQARNGFVIVTWYAKQRKNKKPAS